MSAAAGDTSPHWLRWAFWIVLAGFLFLHPTRPAFWGSHNESRRAQISAEMLRPDASFFVPTLNGEPILTKPPLGYWLQAMSLRLFGINEGSARLPGMLAALFVVILVFRAGSRWQGRDVGTVSAAVLTSSLLFMEWCRYAELDIIFAALIATSMVCLMRAVTEPDKRRTAIFQFWVAAGLGFMVKGPFAFIFPLAGLLCYCAWQRDWALLRATFLNLGVVAALLICLPYYLYLLTQVDGAKAVLLGETVSRFDGQSVHRAGLLYYVKYLPLFGPWLLLLIPAIWTRVKARDREPVGMFLVAFLVGSFVVASLVSSKKPQYLLPLAPAAALLVGEWVSGSSLTYSRRVIALSASCVALVALGLPAAVSVMGGPLGSTVESSALAALAVFVLLMLCCRSDSSLGQGALGLAMGFLLCGNIVTQHLKPAMDDQHSARRFAVAVGQLLDTQAISSFQTEIDAISFYAQRPIPDYADPESIPADAEWLITRRDRLPALATTWRYETQLANADLIATKPRRSRYDLLLLRLRTAPLNVGQQ